MATTRQRAQLTHWGAATTGLTALIIGTLVYLIDRPAETAPFFTNMSVAHWVPNAFGPIGRSLPTFTHVFAFSIFTATWLGCRRRSTAYACLVWCLIDLSFEFGQHAAVAPYLFEWVPDSFENFPILRHADGYFAAGTFDAADVMSIVFGAVTAYLVTIRVAKRRSNHA